ncbi:DUF4931 domain-containing protein [Candidatus Woesearchaeota archaeon]|nr:DUF4931 domain-containing protein [Candidatus Woesearchaeota archaeon]
MPELRKDYILDRYVIIAKERAKRPEQFIDTDKDCEEPKSIEKGCFFCPGNEHMTPPELFRTGTAVRWKIRVFDNKFSAVGKEGNPLLRTDNNFFTFADAVGRHEVIVETAEHNRQLWDLSENEITSLLQVYSMRVSDMQKDSRIKYVAVFKNHKKKAGTSIVHSHSQVIGYNIIPQNIIEKEKAVERYGYCPYCRIIGIESGSDRRIHENKSSVSFAPYASAAPFEACIFPKRHVISIKELDETELCDIAEQIALLTGKLKKLDAPFNMFLQCGTKDMHFHIVIEPRITLRAGFEYCTGTIINIMPPETAAGFYRER